MPSEQSILERIAALETQVANLETKASVTLKIGAVNDSIGTVLADVAIINEKLQNIMIPEDTRYYLSTDELAFIRDGMKKVTKMMVELENLRDSLLRGNNIWL